MQPADLKNAGKLRAVVPPAIGTAEDLYDEECSNVKHDGDLVWLWVIIREPRLSDEVMTIYVVPYVEIARSFFLHIRWSPWPQRRIADTDQKSKLIFDFTFRYGGKQKQYLDIGNKIAIKKYPLPSTRSQVTVQNENLLLNRTPSIQFITFERMLRTNP